MTRAASAGLWILIAAGCHTRASVPAPEAYVTAKQPESVWITQRDHSVVRVRGPHMIGDTVVGDVRRQYVKIALSDVERVTVTRFSMGRTVTLAAAGGAVVIGGVVLMLSHYGGHKGVNTCLTPNDFEDICGGPTP